MVFHGASGFKAIRAIGKHKGDYLPAVSLKSNEVTIETRRLHLRSAGGPDDAWATWYQQVIAFGDTCKTQCDADWQASSTRRRANAEVAIRATGIIYHLR
jgi:hypothetical protein